MGYEDKFLHKLDRARVDIQQERRLENREDINYLIKTLVPQEYESASSYLKASALQLGSFRDLYGYENVGRDMEKVKSLKAIFAENDKSNFSGGTTMAEVRKLSEITESYLLRGINESKWIPYCNAIKTSDFDDYERGVDIVLEFQKGDESASHIGLGIDVTFSASLENKLRKIKDDIDDGFLPSLKYFDSPKSHIRGELKQVPRGIVGFDKDAIARLAKQRQSTGGLSTTDPTRLVTLRQLDLQFTTYVEYAERINSKSLPALTRSAKFIKLLYTYVYQHTDNPSGILAGNTQILNLNKNLAQFSSF